MNTILHLPAVLASFWLSIFAFETLSEPALGGAMYALFFSFICLTIAALDDDLVILRGRGLLSFRTNKLREGISTASKIAVVFTVFIVFMATFDKVGSCLCS